MNAQEQVRIVEELTKAVSGKIVAEINNGKIPSEWDGFELRQLLADRFAESTATMARSRRREYNNTRLVNNL